MPRRIGFLLLLAATSGSAGCADPKLDVSDEPTMRASVARLQSHLDEPGKAQLQGDMMTIAEMPTASRSRASVSGRERPAPRMPTLVDLFKPMHGMTAAEIHARAEAMRAAARNAK